MEILDLSGSVLCNERFRISGIPRMNENTGSGSFRFWVLKFENKGSSPVLISVPVPSPA